MRLVLAEIAILNAAGAALAVLVGAWMLPPLLAIAPATTKVLGPVALDWRVMLYAGLCAIGASVTAGAATAWGAGDRPASTQSSIGRSTETPRRQRTRTALLVAQTALSVAMLVAGGLLVRAFVRTGHQQLGYDASGVVTAQLQLPPSRYANGPERVAAMERIFDRVAAIPGVVQAGATMNRFTPGFS
jgi:hypothetical protein